MLNIRPGAVNCCRLGTIEEANEAGWMPGKPMNSPETIMPKSLAPSRAVIEAMGEAAVRLIADYYGGLDTLAVFPPTSHDAIRTALDDQLPTEGRDFASLLTVIR